METSRVWELFVPSFLLSLSTFTSAVSIQHICRALIIIMSLTIWCLVCGSCIELDMNRRFMLHSNDIILPKQYKGIVLMAVHSDRDREVDELRELYYCQERTVILSVDQNTRGFGKGLREFTVYHYG